MATNYIKVRPYVAEQIGVGGSRAKYPDGNLALWEKDLGLIDRGWPRRRDEVVAAIGGVLFDPYQSRDEHDRKPEECTPLPEPTDPAWRGPMGMLEPAAQDATAQTEDTESSEDAPETEGGGES